MKELFITGPVGKLETIITPPEKEKKPIIAIICHPHPLYGGSMNNKVVTTCTRAFYDLGIWSVRFNFRGIGKSEGSYGEVVGEIDDLMAVLKQIRADFPSYKIWLAGFSFGAYIAISVAEKEKEKIEQLITIAPAVTHFDFKDLTAISCPWLLIMGEADEIVSFEQVKIWLAKITVPITTLFYPGVGHFFHGHLVQLREDLKHALKSNI